MAKNIRFGELKIYLFLIFNFQAMVIGLMHKFQENPPLLDELLATDGAELIEASPFDGRWGAKMGTKRILDGDRWRGKNFLGRILMAIRAHLLSPDVNFRVVNVRKMKKGQFIFSQ
jgi:hypothetical protein